MAKYLPYFEKGPPPPRKCDETPKQTKERLKLEKREETQTKEIESGVEAYEKEKESIKGDPYKTIFVGRLSTDVDERKLRRVSIVTVLFTALP